MMSRPERHSKRNTLSVHRAFPRFRPKNKYEKFVYVMTMQTADKLRDHNSSTEFDGERLFRVPRAIPLREELEELLNERRNYALHISEQGHEYPAYEEVKATVTGRTAHSLKQDLSLAERLFKAGRETHGARYSDDYFHAKQKEIRQEIERLMGLPDEVEWQSGMTQEQWIAARDVRRGKRKRALGLTENASDADFTSRYWQKHDDVLTANPTFDRRSHQLMEWEHRKRYAPAIRKRLQPLWKEQDRLRLKARQGKATNADHERQWELHDRIQKITFAAAGARPRETRTDLRKFVRQQEARSPWLTDETMSGDGLGLVLVFCNVDVSDNEAMDRALRFAVFAVSGHIDYRFRKYERDRLQWTWTFGKLHRDWRGRTVPLEEEMNITMKDFRKQVGAFQRLAQEIALPRTNLTKTRHLILTREDVELVNALDRAGREDPELHWEGLSPAYGIAHSLIPVARETGDNFGVVTLHHNYTTEQHKFPGLAIATRVMLDLVRYPQLFAVDLERCQAPRSHGKRGTVCGTYRFRKDDDRRKPDLFYCSDACLERLEAAARKKRRK